MTLTLCDRCARFLRESYVVTQHDMKNDPYAEIRTEEKCENCKKPNRDLCVYDLEVRRKTW